MKRSTVLTAAVWLATIALTGCDSVFKADPLIPPNRDVSAALQTDELNYRLEPEDSWFVATIPYAAHNRTSEPIYIVNCGGATFTDLEKLVDGEWVRHWSAIIPLCLSAPIVIDVGAVIQRELRFSGALPSCNCGPRFVTDEIEGIYRIVHSQIVHGYDEELRDFGQVLPKAQRTSNAFVLRR